jgi:predicted ferric reductase
MKKFSQLIIVLAFPTLFAGIPLATAVAAPMVSATTTQQPSAFHELVTKAKLSWPWYVTRASGMVAAGLLVLLIISGIGQVTGFTYRLMEPLAAWSVHRALGIALGATILIHGSALLFDKYTPFTILQVLVPFASHYTPVTIWRLHLGSLYVALGILAFYAAAIIICSSLFWMNKKPVAWRLLHYTSYLLVFLVFLHGLFLGTDIKHGVFRILWWLSGLVILVGVISRLRRVRTIKEDRPR